VAFGLIPAIIPASQMLHQL